MPRKVERLTVPEAARLAGVDPSALRQAIRAGRLKAQRIGAEPRGIYLVTRADLSKYLDSRLTWREHGNQFEEES